MSLEQEVATALKTAMLAKDEAAVRGLRAVKQGILMAKTSGSGSISAEEEIKMLQDAGGVANETNLLGTFIYQLGTGKGDFGMSSAVSVVMLLLTIALSWYYVRSLMKEEAS